MLYKKCGAKAFLRPKDLGYPVMDDTCNYNCGLLLAAYLRANQKHKPDLAKKAAKLYVENDCEHKHPAHVEIHKYVRDLKKKGEWD